MSKPTDNIEITDSWRRFIYYCQVIAPHSEVKVKIVSGQPTDLLDIKQKIRFDKEETLPITV